MLGGMSMKKTFVRFEHGPHGVVGPTIGPYEWVQWTYDNVRDDADQEIAGRNKDGTWQGPDGQDYTDIIVWG